jgi:glutathione S-transferase
MKLCGFRVSNYHNKVRIVLLEKGIEHEEDPTCFPSQKPEFLKRTPMGKAPFLETPSGILCESAVICEYLEDAYPEKPLFPRDPFARAKVREIIQVLELHVELVMRRVYGVVFFGGVLSDEAKADVRKDLAKGIRAFNHLATFDPFVAGSEFTLADCAAAIHFPLMTFAGRLALGEDVFTEIPKLSAYMEMIAQRPAIARVFADRDQAMAAFAKR